MAGRHEPFSSSIAFALILVSPASTSDGYRAACDGAVRTALSYLVLYDGDSYPCHARYRDQGYASVEWYDPRTAIYAWLLEPDFCVAQGALYGLHVQRYKLALIGCGVMAS